MMYRAVVDGDDLGGEGLLEVLCGFKFDLFLAILQLEKSKFEE